VRSIVSITHVYCTRVELNRHSVQTEDSLGDPTNEPTMRAEAVSALRRYRRIYPRSALDTRLGPLRLGRRQRGVRGVETELWEYLKVRI